MKYRDMTSKQRKQFDEAISRHNAKLLAQLKERARLKKIINNKTEEK